MLEPNSAQLSPLKAVKDHLSEGEPPFAGAARSLPPHWNINALSPLISRGHLCRAAPALEQPVGLSEGCIMVHHSPNLPLCQVLPSSLPPQSLGVLLLKVTRTFLYADLSLSLLPWNPNT